MSRALPLRWWRGCIVGEPASKANSRRLVRRGKLTVSIKSQKALDYAEAARLQVPALGPDRILRGRLSLTAHVWYATQRPDLDVSLILDVLQGRIYHNDRQIREMHLFHHIDRAHPRTEINCQEILDDDDEY